MPSTVMPAGGVRPSGSVSWRPRATMAWRTSSPSRRAGGVPKAAWAVSPHGSAGFVFTSITSATRVNASVRRPSSTRRCSGSVPSRIASPRRRSLTRPGVGGAQRPVEVRGVAAGHDREARGRRLASTFSTSRESSSILAGRGRRRSGTPGWCRARRARRPGVLDDAGGTGRRRRPRARPRAGRRARPSGPRRGSVPWLSAAAAEAVEDRGLGVQADVGVAHHRVDLAQHRRADQRASAR